ncbi:MAG: hypothetical protein ACOVOO_00470 [Flavobacteriales bacterium]|jgi:hypothetical protein
MKFKETITMHMPNNFSRELNELRPSDLSEVEEVRLKYTLEEVEELA